MSYTHLGVRATWNYSKHCWVFTHNGFTYYAFDDEIDEAIADALAS